MSTADLSQPRRLNKWVMRGVRLSLVVGIVNAGWYTWNQIEKKEASDREWRRIETTYKCVARIPDAQLAPHVNEFGNIDAQAVGCSSQPSWVSKSELADMRSGSMRFEDDTRFFSLEAAIVHGVGATIATLLLTFLLAAIFRIGGWVWGDPAKKSGS